MKSNTDPLAYINTTKNSIVIPQFTEGEMTNYICS